MTSLLSRDEALALMLPLVADQGWSMATLRAALVAAGANPIDADILFPGGTVDLVEGFIDRANRAMEAGAASLDLPALRLSQRIHALIALRLGLLHPHKEAVRRALAVLARNPARAAVSTATTVDTLWHLAGDTSADFSWYTKRATLAAIYTATLLFWLRDPTDDDSQTLGFLDRRLAGSRNIARLRSCIEDRFNCVRPAA